MAGETKSVLRMLLGGLDGRRPDRELLCDVILMAALADGFISPDEFDRIGRTIATYAELDGLDWDFVVHRANQLRRDAPLFFESRQQLCRELVDPKKRRLGISLAAKVLGSTRPLQEEERAILHSLAESFEIGDAERESLLSPWAQGRGPSAPLGYDRARFNDPNDEQPVGFFDALANTEEDTELRLLLHKLVAVRAAMNRFFAKAELESIGEFLKIGPYHYRVDALVVGDECKWLMRFLAPGEALHLLERSVLATLLARLAPDARIFVVHSRDLSPSDAAYLDGLDRSQVRVERLDMTPPQS